MEIPKAKKIMVPEPPQILPGEKKAEWKETYHKALAQAADDHPGDEVEQRQSALREANRMLRVPKPESHEDVAKLAEWQIVKKTVKDGKLTVVTIDGKKHTLAAPRPPAPKGGEKVA